MTFSFEEVNQSDRGLLLNNDLVDLSRSTSKAKQMDFFQALGDILSWINFWLYRILFSFLECNFDMLQIHQMACTNSISYDAGDMLFSQKKQNDDKMSLSLHKRFPPLVTGAVCSKAQVLN